MKDLCLSKTTAKLARIYIYKAYPNQKRARDKSQVRQPSVEMAVGVIEERKLINSVSL